MSKLLRRSIKKFTIPRTRHSSTPTTSAIFYCDASRGWIPRKLGTHSEAPRITSTIFLPALDAAVDFMQYSFAIVAIFLLDISNSRSSFNVFKFTSNSVSPRALFGGLCDHSQIFLFTSTPIYHNWTTPFFFWCTSPTLFCRLCLHHWSLPLLSTFRETLHWAILVWESKILPTPPFSIACFLCWNGSHFCLWGCSWR